VATFLLLISAQHRACHVLLLHSLPFLTPKVTCGLLVPVLDQGLVEMNIFITTQPSSLGITVAECSWLHQLAAVDVSRVLHVPRLCCTSSTLLLAQVCSRTAG